MSATRNEWHSEKIWAQESMTAAKSSRDEYIQELEEQLGQNILELRDIAHAIRAQYIKMLLYLIPAAVLTGVIISYIIWELRVGDSFQSHTASIGGTLGVFGLFLLSELITMALGALQSINRGNRVRYLQVTAIHEAESELGRAGIKR